LFFYEHEQEKRQEKQRKADCQASAFQPVRHGPALVMLSRSWSLTGASDIKADRAMSALHPIDGQGGRYLRSSSHCRIEIARIIKVRVRAII
jgi:hypothetical protein